MKLNINDKQKGEKEELTQNIIKLLDQISYKDKEIFDLKKEVSEFNNKISKEYNDRKTQNMLNGITEKELKSNINELQNIINEKDNELVELRTKYDNIKYNSKKIMPKIHFIEDSDEEPDNGYSKVNKSKILFIFFFFIIIFILFYTFFFFTIIFIIFIIFSILIF